MRCAEMVLQFYFLLEIDCGLPLCIVKFYPSSSSSRFIAPTRFWCNAEKFGENLRRNFLPFRGPGRNSQFFMNRSTKLLEFGLYPCSTTLMGTKVSRTREFLLLSRNHPFSFYFVRSPRLETFLLEVDRSLSSFIKKSTRRSFLWSILWSFHRSLFLKKIIKK